MREEPPVAVVSGGGSGIGRAMALCLARRGYRLALLGRRQEALLETLRLAGDVNGLACSCDVRDAAAVADAAHRVESLFGPASVLVPAAGTVTVAPLDALGTARFAEVVDTNLAGTFHLLHAFLPQLRRLPRTWIFPVLSLAAERGFAGWSAYCASKWGVRGLIAALREELRGTGVRITAIFAGATSTEIWDTLPGSWERDAMIRVEDVSAAIEWALSVSPGAELAEIHLGPAGGPL